MTWHSEWFEKRSLVISKPWRIVPGAGCNPAVTDFTSLPHMLKRQSLLSTFLFRNTPTRTIRHSLPLSSISLPNLPFLLAPCLLHCKLHWLFSNLRSSDFFFFFFLVGGKKNPPKKKNRLIAGYGSCILSTQPRFLLVLFRSGDRVGEGPTKL